jgi:hypothetical protein
MDVLVKSPHELESRACSALPVGQLERQARTFVSSNAGIVCNQVFPGAIPWGESSAKLFR